MRRLAVPLALLVAAGVVSAGIALVLDARDTELQGGTQPRESLTVVSATVRPTVHPFGEPVVAELVLVADTELVRLDSLRIEPEFAPYEAAGPVQVERTQSGSAERWRFRYPLRCLREGCAPDGSRRAFDFPLTNVVYRFRSTPGPASAIVDWPPFEVAGRVDDAALTRRTWRADVTSVPDVSYRWAPGVVAAALLAGSAAFAGVGVGLAWWLARRREQPDAEADEVEEPPRTPLERALELAREASRNGDSPDRRKALERVARELGARGLVVLAERARALAWASGGGDPVAVDELVRDAHAATNGGTG